MAKTRKNRKSKQAYWGYHLIVNASNCDHDAIRSKKTIAEFTKDIVNKVDMVAYGPPRIVMFGTGNKKGYTLVQLIETSDITAHFVEETNDMYFDLFSCKPYDPKVAIATLQKFFNPKKMNTHFIKRQA